MSSKINYHKSILKQIGVVADDSIIEQFCKFNHFDLYTNPSQLREMFESFRSTLKEKIEYAITAIDLDGNEYESKWGDSEAELSNFIDELDLDEWESVEIVKRLANSSNKEEAPSEKSSVKLVKTKSATPPAEPAVPVKSLKELYSSAKSIFGEEVIPIIDAAVANSQRTVSLINKLEENKRSELIKFFSCNGLIQEKEMRELIETAYRIQAGTLNEETWTGGTWEDGTWDGGIWKNGQWKRGTWQKGIWNDGIWNDGTWKNGFWYDGLWYKGTWKDGTWKDGTWKNGFWEDGTWEKGIWRDGRWKGGTWKGGTWKTGWIHDPKREGNLESSWKTDGNFVQSPISPAEYWKGK